MHQPRPQQAARAGEALVLLHGKTGHRDDRRQHAAAFVVEVSGGDRDDPPKAAAAPEGLQREARLTDLQ